MSKTQDLIAKLSSEARVTKPLRKPLHWMLSVFSLLVFYAVISQIFLGLRVDIFAQITRPLFFLEVVLMLLLFLTSLASAVLTMYPDLYQKSRLLKLPYVIFFALLAVLTLQIFTPIDAQMILPEGNIHKMECSVCILFLSLIPSAYIFITLQKGATVNSSRSGIFAVLAATALGCLILRLSEANDSIIHLLAWHYLPTFLFAAIGAILGKLLLRWS
ncbi:MAG: DUF1109 family protein [Proteobacteria bacterium]|nr:DUF1109 family protein [Pseudomonadota bacterium]